MNLRIIGMIIPVFIFFSSCVTDFKGSVAGNGKIVTEEREAEPFNELVVSSGLEVTVLFGEEPSIEVEADENLMEVIRTDFNKGKLRIKTDLIIRRAKSKKIHLTVPEIHSLKVSGAAYVKSRNMLKTEEIEIEVSSAGVSYLEAEARIIQVEVSSAGTASLTGNAGELHAEVSSAGKLNAYDLVSKYCKVNASSAGTAKVNVRDELEAEASSAGSISYMGDPKDTRIEKSSAGSVLKK